MRKRLKSTAQDERAVAEEGSRAGQRCGLLSHAERRKENEANICANLIQFVNLYWYNLFCFRKNKDEKREGQ